MLFIFFFYYLKIDKNNTFFRKIYVLESRTRIPCLVSTPAQSAANTLSGTIGRDRKLVLDQIFGIANSIQMGFARRNYRSSIILHLQPWYIIAFRRGSAIRLVQGQWVEHGERFYNAQRPWAECRKLSSFKQQPELLLKIQCIATEIEGALHLHQL